MRNDSRIVDKLCTILKHYPLAPPTDKRFQLDSQEDFSKLASPVNHPR